MSKQKNILRRETAGDKTPQAAHAGTNARLIGAFMLGAIALIVVIFLVFGSGEFFKDKTKYVVYFRCMEHHLRSLPILFPLSRQRDAAAPS